MFQAIIHKGIQVVEGEVVTGVNVHMRIVRRILELVNCYLLAGDSMKKVIPLLIWIVFLAGCVALGETTLPESTSGITPEPEQPGETTQQMQAATPLPTPLPPPTAEATPIKATVIPPFPNEIPNSVQEFEAQVASGEIPTFTTDAELQAHIDELSQQWLLVDKFNVLPATFFGKGYDHGSFVKFVLMNRINFIVRDYVIGPDGVDLVLCELILPDGNHKIAKWHEYSPSGLDKDSILKKSLKSLEEGDALSIFVFTSLGTVDNDDPKVRALIEGMPEDIREALDSETYPSNIDDTTIVISGVIPFPYPADVQAIVDQQ